MFDLLSKTNMLKPNHCYDLLIVMKSDKLLTAFRPHLALEIVEILKFITIIKIILTERKAIPKHENN